MPATRTPPTGPHPLWPVTLFLLALALAWLLSDVLLLVFAGVLMALVLHRLAMTMQARVGLRAALTLVVLALLAALVIGSWLAGASIATELVQLRETLPRAWQGFREWLGTSAAGRWVLEALPATQQSASPWAARIAGWVSSLFNGAAAAIGALVLVFALGVYFAVDPAPYRNGLLRLVPEARRARATTALDAAAHDLTRWLQGQAVSMLAVGTLTAIGLWALGVPLVLTLSVLTAVLDFVPYFGSLAASVLIVAVASTDGERQAVYAAVMCLAVQQAEAYIVQPLAQRWAVRLPPALSLVAVLVFGLLFGLPGVLLAVPLMVLAMSLVQTLLLASR